jgi:hypothetical protein
MSKVLKDPWTFNYTQLSTHSCMCIILEPFLVEIQANTHKSLQFLSRRWCGPECVKEWNSFLNIMEFINIKDSENVVYKITPKSCPFSARQLATSPETEELSFKTAFIISLDRRQVANSVIHKYGT